MLWRIELFLNALSQNSRYSQDSTPLYIIVQTTVHLEQHMSISNRKADHIDLCINGDVDFKSKTTLFEDVELIHNPLPELHINEIDLATEFAGKKLKAPLIIAAMTGGVERADKINKDLASVAEELGLGFGFGSQRPLLQGITAGYQVRDVAPTALLLGNIAMVQARDASTEQLEEIIRFSGVDALCVHLNPAMEVIQSGGDEDFRGGYDCIARLLSELSVPLVIKETGCGFPRSTGQKLAELGVKWLDSSGAGGTSWVAVETHRAEAKQRVIGNRFWDWGIPTAATVLQNQNLGLGICATGGMNDGLMVAKAIALGASCGGMARPVLKAYALGGKTLVKEFLEQTIQEIRIAMLLTGSANISALQKQDLILGSKIERWNHR